MKLIAGLGNPGRKYEGTRHNIGYAVLGALSRRLGAVRPKERFQADVVEGELGGHRLLLLAPRTYMNLSGTSVLAARDFYKIPDDQLLVVCDDLNLPLGKLRFRARGTSGGQKGLADVIRRLGTEEFARLRIGIGSPPEGWDPADFVLAHFVPDEVPVIRDAVERAAGAVEEWIGSGIEHCMNRYN